MRTPTAPAKSHRTIRFWLSWLAVACALPGVLISAVTIARSFQQERAGLGHDTVAMARAISQTVDTELSGLRAALTVLSYSPLLDAGELSAFHGQASEVVRAINGHNIVLTDRAGRQLVNTLKRFGEPLPMRRNLDSLRRVIDAQEPIISDLFIGSVTQRPIIAIEVPVIRHQAVVYSLAIGILPERLREILGREKIPAEWTVGIVDTTGKIVARTVGGDEMAGRSISPGLREAMTKSAEGAFNGRTLEGVPVFSGFSRSNLSKWTIAIGIPEHTLFGVLWESLAITIVAAILVLLAGVFLAKSISDRISRSLLTLSNAGANPTPATLAAIDIREVRDLGQTLYWAHQQIERHGAERDDLRRRIMAAHEEERLRLAHDLHDQTGQSVTAALLDLKTIEPFVAEQGRRRLRVLSQSLNEIARMLHRIAWELRPASLDELGLTNVLQTYFEEWSRKRGVEVEFDCKDTRLDQYSDEVRTTIYRVIQEALNNVAKHADATRVSAMIEGVSGTLRLTIRDNGRGFDDSSASTRLGLAGMRERVLLIGGLLKVESSSGNGTMVLLSIPIKDKAPA
jgi:signal transduction histidine kinase